MQKTNFWIYFGEVVTVWWRNYWTKWGVFVATVFSAIVIFWNQALTLKWYVLGITLVSLILPLFFWIPYQKWRGCHPEIINEQKRNPKIFVKPYIKSVNAYQLKLNSEKFILLDVCEVVPKNWTGC